MRFRKHLLATIAIATLPLAAGFAMSGGALAQDAPYGQVPVVGAGQSASAEMTRVSALEQQIRDLTNQLEQRDNQLRQLQSAFDKFSADTNTRLQDLESRSASNGTPAPANQAAASNFESPASDGPNTAGATPPMPAPMGQTGTTTGAAADAGTLDDANGAFKPDSSVQGRADRALGQIVEPSAKGKGEALTSGKPQTSSPAQAYDQAFSYLQQNKAADAQHAFSDFLKAYPTHPLAANAQYWLGESYFAQAQYPVAAKTFAKSFQDHPQSQKAPDSLFKLALTLEKMNKKDDACLTLKELNKRFTSGPASVLRRASEEGQRMGCKA